MISTNTFSLSMGREMMHNTTLIEPVVPFTIYEMYIIGPDGKKVSLLTSPVEVTGPSSISYEPISSSNIWMSISAEYADQLTHEDFFSVKTSMDSYKKHGSFTSRDNNVSFNKRMYLYQKSHIPSGCYCNCTISFYTKDRFGNHVYSGEAQLPIGDNQRLFQDIGINPELRYEPEESTLIVLADSEVINDYTVKEGRIIFDKIDGVDFFAIYKPKYVSQGGTYHVNENVSISPSGAIILNDENCSSIEYSVLVNIVNVSGVKDTPIIKNLAVITSE